MKIQVNGSHHVHASEALGDTVTAVLEAELARFSRQITRVEVHMSDENAAKGGQNDKRCTIEARLQGRPPVAATGQGATMRQAFEHATDALVRLIGHALDRVHDPRAHAPDPLRSAEGS